MPHPVVDIQQIRWTEQDRYGSSVVGCNMLGNYSRILPLRDSLPITNIQNKYQDRFYKLSWSTGKLMKNDPYTLLTAIYDPSNGNISLKFIGHEYIAINHVRILSPTQIMSEDTATLPSATYTVNNDDSNGLYGVGSEIYFYSPDSVPLGLDDSAYGISDTYNLGNICPPDLNQEDIDTAFAITASDTHMNIPLFGYFSCYIASSYLPTIEVTPCKIKVKPLNMVDGGNIA